MTNPLPLLASAHGGSLRVLCDALHFDCDGLKIAARHARRQDLISDKMFKTLMKVDAAFALARHITGPKVDELMDDLSKMVSSKASAVDRAGAVCVSAEVPLSADAGGDEGSDGESLARSTTCGSQGARNSSADSSLQPSVRVVGLIARDTVAHFDIFADTIADAAAQTDDVGSGFVLLRGPEELLPATIDAACAALLQEMHKKVMDIDSSFQTTLLPEHAEGGHEW